MKIRPILLPLLIGNHQNLNYHECKSKGVEANGLLIKLLSIVAFVFTTALSSQALEPTSATSGTINGHDYFDLGLSVKWATCNVGASKPSDYGNYYAWG